MNYNPFKSDESIGYFKAVYNFITYGLKAADTPQMISSSCRNNEVQEAGYNAAIAEIVLNRKAIDSYIERRKIEAYTAKIKEGETENG
jgi:hypothetical protein